MEATAASISVTEGSIALSGAQGCGKILSMENNTWAFLRSPRFYAMALGAIALWLFQDGFISAGLATAIATITAGYTLVRTADRNGDKRVESAEITSGVDTITFDKQ